MYNGNHEIGLIAQEVKDYFPQLVINPEHMNAECSATSQEGCYKLNYDRFGIVALQGIKELNFKVENGFGMMTQAQIVAFTAAGAIANYLTAVQIEAPRNVIEYFTTKLTAHMMPITDFASARVTAIRGYFDSLFAKNIETENLCIKDTAGAKTCITKSQLDALISHSATSGNASVQTQISTNTGTQTTPDATAPVITITGGSTMTLTVGDAFNIPATSVMDNKDTGLVAQVDSNNVDATVAGIYTVEYSATDSANNKGTATLTVTVVAQ